jgi:hypothetical protein
MKLLSVAVILAALGPPDWLPPAPDVLLTQVDANGKELSDSFPAVCGLGVCRGALPVIFTDGSCLVRCFSRRRNATEGQGWFRARRLGGMSST